MREITIQNIKSLAPRLLAGEIPYPLPAYGQHALSILKILEDGNWHTSAEIAQSLGIGKKYARDILRACKPGWGLESSNPQGWRLVKY